MRDHIILVLSSTARARSCPPCPRDAQVREFWELRDLDVVPYRNKCHLVRGWDELFTKLAEHLASLASMKLSPFYKV